MREILAKLNGWQRLWVVLSGVWLFIVGLLLIVGSGIPLFSAVMIWAIPPIVLYIVGLAIKWILGGFTKSNGG